MLLKNVTKKDSSIISIPGIITIFCASIITLTLLYPKDKIHQLVINEKSNYDLTSIYLKNLIKLNPSDTKLILTMANTLTQQKKFDLAKNILENLTDNSDEKIRQEAVLAYLNINNIILEKKNKPSVVKRIIDKNHSLLRKISKQKITDLKNSKTLYYAALSIDDTESAINFSKILITLTSGEEQLKWLKNTHYIAVNLNKNELDKDLLMMLSMKDKSNLTKTWITSLNKYLDSDDDIDKLAKSLFSDKESKAFFYLTNKRYKEASELYQDLFEKEKNQKKKKELLITIIDSMRANNQSKDAAKIVNNYEDLYISDTNITTKLLKLYIEASRSDLAKKLSIKIINQREKNEK